jgi:hypothetical protein
VLAHAPNVELGRELQQALRVDSILESTQEVARRAQAILGERLRDYRPTTQVAAAGLAEGGQVTLVPEVDGLAFEPRSRSFFWQDSVHEASFDLRLLLAPRRGHRRTVHGPRRGARRVRERRHRH